MELAPIVLFVYNRPWHLRQTVESLNKNELAESSELFIFSDGPKSEKGRKKIFEVREYCKTITGFKSVTLIEREWNLGLGNSIITGVTEIINKYGRIIVLEDDIISSPFFLKFMNDALEIYKDIPKVMHISGYMFPVNGELPETFFYRATSCWGWATWKRAWNRFELDADKLLKSIKNKRLQHEFDIKGSMKYFDMLRDNANGKIDIWAIRWYASVFLEDGLCLHPGESLVNNCGHDGSGIHCGASNVFRVKLAEKRVSNFTKDIRENECAVRLMADFNKSLKSPFLVRVLNKVKRIFNGN